MTHDPIYRLQEIAKRVELFLKNETYPEEVRNIVGGFCKTLLSTKSQTSPYILGGLEIVLDTVIDFDNGNVETAFTKMEHILTILSNVNPLERIANNRNSLATIRVAVGQSIKEIDKSQLKRDSLYFDHFAFNSDTNIIQEDPELSFLNEQGVIQTLEFDNSFKKGLRIAEQNFIDEMLQNNTTLKFDYDIASNKLHGLSKLINANGVSEVPNFQGIPWFKDETEYISTFKNGSNSCLAVLLKSLPVPDESTPWESILDFRKNNESIEKRQSLIAWQNKLFKQNLSALEIGDELQYLLNEYDREMKLLKIKTRLSTVKTLIVAIPELIENIVKLKFKSIAENLFSLAEAKVSLNEKLANMNGKEIAYIPYSRGKFDKPR